MKRLLLLFILVTAAVVVEAQTTITEQLLQKVNEHPQGDTIRVNRIIDMLRWLSLPYSQQQQFSEEALSISKNLGYAKGAGYSLSYLGYIEFIFGNKDSAKTVLLQADSIAKNIHDDVMEAQVLSFTGRVYQSVDNKKALDYYLQSVALAERTNDKLVMARCYNNIGSYYSIGVDDFPKSLDYLMKAESTAEDANDFFNLASAWGALGSLYSETGDDTVALNYYQKGKDAYEKIGNKTQQRNIANNVGEIYRLSAKYPEAIKAYNESLEGEEAPASIYITQSNLADVYEKMDNLPLAFQYGFETLRMADKNGDLEILAAVDAILSDAYLKEKRPDSALYYATQGMDNAKKIGTLEFMRDNALSLSNVYAFKSDFKNSYEYYRRYVYYRDSMLSTEIKNELAVVHYSGALQNKQAQISELNQQKKVQQGFLVSSLVVLLSIIIMAVLLFRNNRQKQKANVLLKKQKEEIDKKAAELAVQKDNLEKSYRNVELLGEIGRQITSSLSVEKIIATTYNNVNALMDASVFGIGIYHDESGKIDFPATYEKGTALPAYSNSIHDENRFAALCFISGNEIVMGDLQEEYKKYLQNLPVPREGDQPSSLLYLPLKIKNEIRGVITVQSFEKNAYTDYHVFMLRNIANYAAIALDNAESYKKLNDTLNALKKTQDQLIQSEKMASLGELTAGIAHEIQNPLNFVNNFAEVNVELLSDLVEEAGRGNADGVQAIASDMKQNLEKIVHHGKRADAIVKGMLQHSRAGSGQKELTDINAMADEYLRLAYHGMRAKNKNFNADLQTDLDPAVGRAYVVRQDFGRVLLNLFNNAFYWTNEKSKMSAGEYTPVARITTRKVNGSIEIRVEDNGNGISRSNLDKIFQPFFTTKPTGEGVGLGLSLSYDIITKVHHGIIKARSEEGKGSEFEIVIPV